MGHSRTPVPRVTGHRALAAALVVMALWLAACSAPATPVPAPPKPRADWPTAGWQIAPAGEHGLDEAKLTALEPEITAQLPFLNSLLIVRDGRLVYEAYFNGVDAASLNELRSVTKSVTSMLAGIAQVRGEVAGPDVTLGKAAPALFAGSRFTDKQKLTLRELLMMRSGVQWDDSFSEKLIAGSQVPAFLQQDIDQFALAQPMAHKPGTAWNYSTLDTQLAAALLEGAARRPLQDYAAEHLFAPLGITRYEWQTDSAGHAVGGGQLQLTARDMAKLGYLYLAGGAWDGQQLVRPDWIRLTTSPQASGVYSDTGQTIPIEWYGMGWWTWKPEVFGGQRAIAARGYGGQAIILLPDLDMIVVATADSVVPPEKADAQDARVYDLVKYSVLPAVTDKRPADPFWAVPAAVPPPHEALYLTGADGRGRRVLLQDPSFGFWGPAWSPDGKQIAFSRTIPAVVAPGTGVAELYVADADGKNLQQLTHNGRNNYLPAWSPDGRTLAYLSGSGDATEIYAIDLESGQETRLTNNSALEYGIAWSPDGKQIAFGTRRDGDWQIYTMKADGSDPRALPTPAAGHSPAWSPDGKHIAFVVEKNEDSDIWVMDADGSNQRPLVGGPSADYLPAWSPDGQSIAYTSWRDGTEAVFVAAADGSQKSRVSGSDLAASFASWSPDGKHLVFHGLAKHQGGLWEWLDR